MCEWPLTIQTNKNKSLYISGTYSKQQKKTVVSAPFSVKAYMSWHAKYVACPKLQSIQLVNSIKQPAVN